MAKIFKQIGKKLVLVDSEAQKEKTVKRDVESHIQCDIVSWFRKEYNDSQYIIAGIPNGAAVSVTNRKRLTREGLFSGFSDLIIIGQKGTFFVEVKTEAKSSKQSNEQKKFEKVVTSFGYKYEVLRSLKEFQEFCKNNL